MKRHGGARKRAHALPNILLALLLLVALAGAFVGYHYFLEKNVSGQLRHDVQRTNDRNRQFFNNFVENIYQSLEVTARLCDAPEGSGEENWWNIVSPADQDGVRLGVAGLDGVLYYGGHQTRDIAHQSYFSQALAGRRSVSSVLYDAEKGQNVLVFAVPIRQEERVVGALCNEYTVEFLGRQLNDSCAPGTGFSLVFAPDGTLVAGGRSGCGDVFDLLWSDVFQSARETNAFRAQLDLQAEGFFEYKPAYFSRAKAHFLYYQPLDTQDWTIVTSLEEGAYESALQKVSQASNLLSFATVVLVSGIVLLMFRMQRQRQRELAVEERDALTGCYTREAALAHAQEYLRSHPHTTGACVFLDIDNFKRINDSLGHDKGDDALVTTGRILREQTRADDIVSRFGGDEFCVWVWDVPCRESAERLAHRLVDRFRSTPNIRVSMGVTLFPLPDDTLERAMKRADQALYRAKRGGRNRYYYLENDEEK